MTLKKRIFLVWLVHASTTVMLIVYLSGSILVAGANNQSLSIFDQFIQLLASIFAMPLTLIVSGLIQPQSLQIFAVILVNSLIWAIVLSIVWIQVVKYVRT
ncbi:MAG: hypothetical protein ABJH06_06270 [Paraglaciecola sp.]|uniref:hypothetical protein n=1 Tax=Paraglaciecola sp. TaxID=1920173 RepID=UPI00329870BD